jgi:hypothetical protein
VYKVKINWKLDQDTDDWWNMACIWMIEEFGLPGDKYKTELTEDYMIFDFEEKENAMIAALRWGNEYGG